MGGRFAPLAVVESRRGGGLTVDEGVGVGRGGAGDVVEELGAAKLGRGGRAKLEEVLFTFGGLGA